MIKAIKYRIYPTKQQQYLLNKTFGCVRWVYNYFLALRNTLYQEQKKSLSCYEMVGRLPELKQQHSWLTDVCANALQQSLYQLDNDFTAFFRHGAEYPRFKQKQATQSFTEPGGVAINSSKLFLPKFREGIRVRQHRLVEGKIKSATILQTRANQHYVILLIDTFTDCISKSPVRPETTIAIDLSDKITLSDNQVFERPMTSVESFMREQRKLARMQKGSRNYQRQSIRVAKAYEHLKNQQKDFLHKLTYKITHRDTVKTICFKDSTKEKVANPLDDTLKLRHLLEYKCDWYGKNLLAIPAAPTTSICPICGFVKKYLQNEDIWTCPVCKTTHNTDVNSAQNIKRIALEQYYRRA